MRWAIAAGEIEVVLYDRGMVGTERQLLESAPRLSSHFESSLPGLYFVGPVSAFSFGPLERFVERGRLIEGEFRPQGTQREWCEQDVLRTIRRRSLAKLRKDLADAEEQWSKNEGRLRDAPDPRKAARAQEILGNKALFREFVDQRHRALRTRADAVAEGDSSRLIELAA